MKVPENAATMQPELKKRRSTRIVQAVPLAVTGVDALGRPFQERTSTLVINCHGARYQSKHYVLKNMWVTLEVPQPEPGRPPRSLRGKVTWIQRPRTVRQLFQIAVELESPGNFWGVAFPPEDWFPPAGSEMTEAAGLSGESETVSTSGNAAHLEGQFPGDNLHVMAPPPSRAEAVEDSIDLARQMNLLLAEAHPKLQAAAHEALKQAVATASKPLLEDLQGRIKEAEKLIQETASHAAEHGAAAAAARLSEAQSAAFAALRNELPKVLGSQIEQTALQLSEQLAKAGAERFAEFDQKLQSALQAAQGTIDKLSEETLSGLERLQTSLQRFETEADNRAESTHLRLEHASREHFDKSSARQQEIASAERRLQEQLNSATDDAASSWRVRLEADLALASSRWEQTMETSMEAAANRAAEHIEQRRQASTKQLEHEWAARAEQLQSSIESATQRTADQAASRAAENAAKEIEELRQKVAHQLEGDWASRAEQIRSSIEFALREAQGTLGSLQSGLEKEAAKARSSLAEIQQATNQSQDVAGKLEGLSRSIVEHTESQLRTITVTEAEKFAKQTEETISAAGRRIQPLLETAGRESVEHLAAEFETRVAAQLERAGEVLKKLAIAEKLPEGLLRVHQEHLQQISDESRNRAVARLGEELAAVEQEFQQKAQAAQTSWFAALEKRASEVQAATDDSLFKSAEWHQKRSETQAQAAFEKRIEDATASLREKAGELSGLFAAELDHYSRSYVEHSQSQMDEAVKETFERARGLFSEAADTTAAAFTDEIQRSAHGELESFQQRLEKAGSEFHTKMESDAEQIKSQISAGASESLDDFQARMSTVIEAGVVTAGNQLEKQLEPLMQAWREITEKHHQRIQNDYERLGNESVETYKQRLENVSNSWTVATVTTLDRQSQDLIAGVAKSAEERLRETCSQVFAGVGDTLRARLQEIAAGLASSPIAPQK